MTIPAVTTVVGAGTMGPGIAAVLARAGSDVRVYDISAAALTRAKAAYDLAVKVLEDLDAQRNPGGSVHFHSELATALDGSEFIVEAVPEKIELKKTVLARIEDAVSASAIIATNTSGIPISDMADGLAHPERLIGMHWSNPPHLIPMIEIIRGDATATAVQEHLLKIVEAFGYEAVLEKETPGFVENRVLYAIMRECLALLEQGIVSQQDLDTCVKWGIGYKLSVVGPMRLLDMAGLDVYENVSSYLNAQLNNSSGVPEMITKLTADGKLGMKSGDGMYAYGEGEVAAKRADIVQGLVAARKALSATKPV